jgi:hypothetical protein
VCVCVAKALCSHRLTGAAPRPAQHSLTPLLPATSQQRWGVPGEGGGVWWRLRVAGTTTWYYQHHSHPSLAELPPPPHTQPNAYRHQQSTSAPIIRLALRAVVLFLQGVHPRPPLHTHPPLPDTPTLP